MTFLGKLADLGRRIVALAVAAIGLPRLEAVRLPLLPLLSPALAPADGQTALLPSITYRQDRRALLPRRTGNGRRMATGVREISEARDSLYSEKRADLGLQPARRRRISPQQL
jgi:hypothetical protein